MENRGYMKPALGKGLLCIYSYTRIVGLFVGPFEVGVFSFTTAAASLRFQIAVVLSKLHMVSYSFVYIETARNVTPKTLTSKTKMHRRQLQYLHTPTLFTQQFVAYIEGTKHGRLLSFECPSNP